MLLSFSAPFLSPSPSLSHSPCVMFVFMCVGGCARACAGEFASKGEREGESARASECVFESARERL